MEDPYHVENIDRLGVLMFQTYKNTQPIYIFNRENSQNSEPQNGPRRKLDFIVLVTKNPEFLSSL